MKLQHAGWALAALVLSAPAFAQTHVQSATGLAVTSGTGLVVTPGAPSMVPLSTHVMGAANVQAGQTTMVDGSRTVVTTHYWVNVPADVSADARFQRWQRLR